MEGAGPSPLADEGIRRDIPGRTGSGWKEGHGPVQGRMSLMG